MRVDARKGVRRRDGHWAEVRRVGKMARVDNGRWEGGKFRKD